MMQRCRERNEVSNGGMEYGSKPSYPITLQFIDVWYKVKRERKQRRGCGGKSDVLPTTTGERMRAILKGISGTVSPGEVLAVMGPSGSGKSTLLSALGGRISGSGISGSILANGNGFGKSIRRRIGFVGQDDILHPHLTVRETLVFCCLLRLPHRVPKKAKMEVAEWWISELGLEQCGDTIVGSALVRGVSGGERKRVSIAHEMVTNPSMVILDEPTSGLDSTAALKVVEMVVRLARGGRTVAMSVHQPSSRAFHMFDLVLLLSQGSCLYFGGGGGAMDHFNSIGFAPSFPVNPADFLLDLANGIYEERAVSPHELKHEQRLVVIPTECSQLSDAREVTEDAATRFEMIVEWTNHFAVLLRRSMKERTPECFNALRLFQVVVSVLISGMIWWHSDYRQVRDRLGLLFCTVMFWTVFSCHSAVFVFPLDRPVLAKERASGSYALSSYFLSRVLGELVLELPLPTTCFALTYWITALKPDAFAFLLSLAVLVLLVLTAQGLGLFLGAAVTNPRHASTGAAVIILAFVLAGGYFSRKIPTFAAWMKYASITYYAYELLIDVQYEDGQTVWAAIGCGKSGTSPYASSCGVVDGEVRGENIQPWVSVAALVAMLFAYRLLAYLALRRIRLRL